MDKKGTSVFSNSLIWFGAGVSIAEIVTGTYLASLGMEKGILAIIIGHLIGCSLLFLAGVIGAKTKKSAMETVKISFGQKGSILFSVLNVIQLAGWTAIMIYDGALSANGIFNTGNWVVHCNRCTYYYLDFYWNKKHRKSKCCCNDSFIYSNNYFV